MCIDANAIGKRLPNGTYDGMIGYVQSNRTNTVSQYFPYDVISDSPGILVQSPIPSFTPHIYSANIRGKPKVNDILNLFSNFSPAIWFFWLISLTLCSIFCLIVKYSFVEQVSIRSACTEFVLMFWDYLMLFLDLAPFLAPTMSTRFTLWTVLCIGVYYGIHLIFMSTLSADLSAPGPDKFIDNMDDLLHDPTFEPFRVTIFSQLNMLNVLSTSLNGSKQRLLLNRAIDQDSVLTISLSQAGIQGVIGLLVGMIRDVVNHTRAIVEDNVFANILIGKLMCSVVPELAIEVVKSNEFVYNSPTAMLMSHTTEPEVVELFMYRSLAGNYCANNYGAISNLSLYPQELNLEFIKQSLQAVSNLFSYSWE